VQRNYEIKSNKREVSDGFASEELKKTSAYLAERHIEILDNLLDGNRSRNLRKIIDSIALKPNEVMVLSEKKAELNLKVEEDE
jgi:hypothetical protein